MNRERIISFITALAVVLASLSIFKIVESSRNDRDHIKIGFVYDGDESTPYTYNFIRAQNAIKDEYGDRVSVEVKSNVPEDASEKSIIELIDAGCDLIFTASYGYGEAAKELAEKHPEIEFCQATHNNANEEPVLANYHTFMGEIYQGRYTAGVVAGMKLKELLDQGKIRPSEAKIGYVGAYPYAEVISGYTSFFLGVRSVVPDAVMEVMYTNSWSDYSTEKEYAEKMIKDGCIIISQHSDTIGPAVACESARVDHPVFHVGYNQSMQDVAPTTSLVSTRINWKPYMLAAVEAVLSGEKIEAGMSGHIHGQDVGAGFEKDWVQMLELNSLICAEGTKEAVDATIEDLKSHKIEVFKGNYTGTDPFDPTDTIDLSKGYEENKNYSAPSFHWVLDDVIKVVE